MPREHCRIDQDRTDDAGAGGHTPSPGGPAGAQPWQVDLDWLWGTPPGNDGSPGTLRLDVAGPGAARAAAA